ncbi:MAG TPA: hypothetical protein VM345_05850 [Acidimicrobiales bacterium]|jgi:hypothetical protein|nr:hypothetical protein [Acidimicrobiales bacterium]
MRKVLLFAAVCAAATGVASGVAASHPSRSDRVERQLAEVRRATAKFHDVRVAEQAGYLDPGPGHCLEVPGLGGMGIHFVNPSLIFDGGVLDPTRPEVLLYVPTAEGGLRLVGVEYLVRVPDRSGSAAPDLFGKPFDGPMPEHEPNTTGDHYDQHAWVWSHNPDGPLATWNKEISCP